MNRLKQTGLIVAAMCVGCLLLIGSAWMAEQSAAQSYGPAVGNAPAGPRKNQPYSNNGDDYPDNSPRSAEPERKEIPADESIWEDVSESEFKNKSLLLERPGNYLVLRAVFDFLDGIRAVEPRMPPLEFPFQKDSKVWNSQDEINVANAKEEVEARTKGVKLQNKWRRYNFRIQSLEIRELSDGQDALADSSFLDKHDNERMATVRSRHKGRLVVAKAMLFLDSLDSREPRDETAGRMIFAFVLRNGEWKMVWFDK